MSARDVRGPLVNILNGLTKQDDVQSVASKVLAVVLRIDAGEFDEGVEEIK